jgi:predicted ATP-grasp superfamily ATP-dependent carboligase
MFVTACLALYALLPPRARGARRDAVALANDLFHGRLSVRGYVASFGGLQVAALFAADDALPGLLEGPLLVFVLCARLAPGDGV